MSRDCVARRRRNQIRQTVFPAKPERCPPTRLSSPDAPRPRAVGLPPEAVANRLIYPPVDSR